MYVSLQHISSNDGSILNWTPNDTTLDKKCQQQEKRRVRRKRLMGPLSEQNFGTESDSGLKTMEELRVIELSSLD